MQSEIDSLKAEIKRLREENASLMEDAAFKPIFNNFPIGIFRTGLNGKFLKVNQTLCDILRYDNPDQLLTSVRDLTKDVYANPEEREEVLKVLKEKQGYTRFELDFKRKNGEVFPAKVSIKLVKDSQGKVKYIEGTAEDISEFKKAETERIKSENLYKKLVNTMADTIVICDISGKIEFVSNAILRMASVNDVSEFIGTNILDWIHPKHHHKAKESIHKIVNKLPYNYEEYELVKKDGTSHFAEIRSTVIESEHGRPSKVISILQDISARKETESVLRQTQDLYRTIIELSPAGILIVYRKEILFLNKALATIFDTSNLWDLIGKEIDELVVDGYKKPFNKLLKNVYSNEEYENDIQVQFKSFKNETKEVKVAASPIFYDGKDCIFLFVNDLTKRVKAEKELQRDKHMMETFWNHLPDAITFKNKEGKYIKVNDTFKRWTNVKNDEQILSLTDREIFDKQHFEKAAEEEKKVIEKGEIIVNKIQKERWPGRRDKWVSLTKMPLFDLNQNIIGVFSFTRDITKEHNAELEIRERERWFRNVFDNSPVAKIISDKRFRVKKTNRSALDLLSVKKEKLLGKSVFNFFDDDEKKKLREKLKAKMESNDNTSFQLESKIKKGEHSSRSVIVQGVYLSGEVSGQGEFLVHMTDIHARKITEDLLLVRNTELNNFVYKVSHDLRAPLTSIKGIINLIKLEKDPAVFNLYVQMISERIERLDLFIRDVLSHSKNLNVEVKIERIDFNQLIDDCVDNVVYQDGKTNIKKFIKVKGKVFYSDYQRVHEILRNLIANAFQYAKKSNKNSFVKIETKTTQKYSRITVEDNGIGIKKQYQPNIFDMFYRANEKVEGSGLGLYIVKLSVEKLQGEIKMQSQHNKGSKFEIILPNHTPK